MTQLFYMSQLREPQMDPPSHAVEMMDTSQDQMIFSRASAEGRSKQSEEGHRCILARQYAWLKDEMTYESVLCIADQLVGAKDRANGYMSQQLCESIRESKRRQAVDLLLKHILKSPLETFLLFLKFLDVHGNEHIADKLRQTNPTYQEIKEFMELQNSSVGRCPRPNSEDERFTISNGAREELFCQINVEAIIDSLNDMFLTKNWFSIREHTNISLCLMSEEKRLSCLLATMQQCSYKIFPDFTEELNVLGMHHVVSRLKDCDLSAEGDGRNKRIQSLDREMEEKIASAARNMPEQLRLASLKDMDCEFESMEIGSIIIHLRPVSNKSWSVLKANCKSGSIMNFVAKVYENRAIYSMLMEGQYEIDVKIYTLDVQAKGTAATAPSKLVEMQLKDHRSSKFETDPDKQLHDGNGKNEHKTFITQHLEVLCEEMGISNALLSYFEERHIVDHKLRETVDKIRSRAGQVRCFLTHLLKLDTCTTASESLMSFIKDSTSNKALKEIIDSYEAYEHKLEKQCHCDLSDEMDTDKQTQRKLFFSATAVLDAKKVDTTTDSDEWKISCSEIRSPSCYFGSKEQEAGESGDEIACNEHYGNLKLYDNSFIDMSVGAKDLLAETKRLDELIMSDLAGGNRTKPKEIEAVKVPQVPPSMPVVDSAIKKCFIVAAIDIGTTFSGYAYSFYDDFKQDPLQITTSHWTNIPGGSCVSCKAPSCILFDKDQQYDSFGYEAEAKYNELVQDEEHYDWHYFETFKMLLYQAQGRPLSKKTLLEDNQRKTMCAMDVFTAAIKALKDHLIETLMERNKDKLNKGQRKGYHVSADDLSDLIQWVLTVPAIWDDAEKQFMREAAINAEIATGNLTIALEPEAASQFYQYLPSKKVISDKGVEIEYFKSGSKYLVLDAGGWVTDITVLEVEHTRTLKELYKASGGNLGGKKVNKAFEQLMAAILGPDVYKFMKFQHRDDYLDLMREIETKKRNVSPTDVGKVNFRLPQSAFAAYSAWNETKLRSQDHIVLQSGRKISFKIDGDKLRINANVIQGLFTETCNNIVARVHEVLSNHVVRGTDTIMLVGGFAESAMLREAIKAEFMSCNVIIPTEADLAVLKGAVLYGHKPESVISRVSKSKYTYGIEAYKSYEPGIDLPNKRVIVQNYVLCQGYFSKHAEIGKEYTPGQSFGNYEYVPAEPGKTDMIISVYRSTLPYPRYCDQQGCSKVGDIFVDLEGEMDRPVVVKLIFGETELGIEAHEKKTGKVYTAKFDLSMA